MTQLTTKQFKFETPFDWPPFDFVLQFHNIPPNYTFIRIFVGKNMNVLDIIHKEPYSDETKKFFIDKVRERMAVVNDNLRIVDDDF